MNHPILKELITGLGVSANAQERLSLSFTGDDCLPSCFSTTELASSSFMAAAVALAEYSYIKHKADFIDAPVKKLSVDNRCASLWFGKSLWALDWQPGGMWDSIAGDYKCADGWIRLHTNAPHHRKCALSVLQCEPTPEAVAATLASQNADEVESAIVAAHGCAATMRSLAAWQQHPQGKCVAAEPLVHWQDHGVIDADSNRLALFNSTVARPLAGVRVLDLTRVIAGPVSTRFLAGHGADVLRIDPASWDEPSVVPEVTLGKRCAHLELKHTAGYDKFLELVKSADVLVHGYRPGAMVGLGLSTDTLLAVNPALITVSLCAYGWTGPWSQRRGFDSLVQMSSGLAHQGMLDFKSDKPHPLPVQALDHATGNLMAAAVLLALAERQKSGRVRCARLSLARTAHVLQRHRQNTLHTDFEPVNPSDLNPDIENTTWGAAQRVRFPVNSGAYWDRPATDLRLFSPQWL